MEKFSLFLLEKKYYMDSTYIGDFTDTITEKCCIYVATFDTLEEAKLAQKEYELKTIILPSYGI